MSTAKYSKFAGVFLLSPFERDLIFLHDRRIRVTTTLAMDEVRGHQARVGLIENSNTKLVDSVSSGLAEYYHQASSAERRTVRQFHRP